MRILLAIRVFFRTLFDADVANAIESLLSGQTRASPQADPTAKSRQKPQAKPPSRSDALTLLATLQREARFVDFVKEPIEDFSDAQVGAAVRDVHRDCATVLDRLFAIGPIASQTEGDTVEVAAGFDAGRWRLSGNVQGEPPFNGRLVHQGWEAAKCELPEWSGSGSAARVVAPVEVEL